MTDTEFSLKLSGGTGITIDQKISKDLATRIALLVLTDGKTDGTNTEGDGISAGAQGVPTPTAKLAALGKTSLREFLNQHTAKKIPQQIVTIGAYQQSKGNKNHFTRDELEKGFEDAKESAPGNWTRDIARTIKEGWIAPKSGVDDQYYVTGTGETAIEKNFDLPKAGGGRRKRGKRKKKGSKAAAK